MKQQGETKKQQEFLNISFSPQDEGQMILLRTLNDLCETEGLNRTHFIRNAIKRELLARGAIQA